VYQRKHVRILATRLQEPRRFIQVLMGPRQTGKTMIARQVREALPGETHYASADLPTLQARSWIEQQWEAARAIARPSRNPAGAVLMLDEVHKITGWAQNVKALWDQDTDTGLSLRVVLLGSSPWAMQRGLAESLAGRFETIPVPHWSFPEMQTAFGWDVERYVRFGGFPGAAPLVEDPARWARYISDSLIETTVSRDILLMTRVDKPALLRRLFDLACAYSGQVLSYQKMVGQLQDAGNTTTLAHYLQLLSLAGIVCGLEKYSGQAVRPRSSSPKLQVFNTAFLTQRSPFHFADGQSDPQEWGRLVESCVGAHLVNARIESGIDVFYWRERGREVDFIIQSADRLAAIEVKSGRPRTASQGLDAFAAAFHPRKRLLVGEGGIPLRDFLSEAPAVWLS
jgi:predicted AAA+ superfamily ATPase